MTETMSPELRCLLQKPWRLAGGDEEESDRAKERERVAGLWFGVQFVTERVDAVNLLPHFVYFFGKTTVKEL